MKTLLASAILALALAASTASVSAQTSRWEIRVNVSAHGDEKLSYAQVDFASLDECITFSRTDPEFLEVFDEFAKVEMEAHKPSPTITVTCEQK